MSEDNACELCGLDCGVKPFFLQRARRRLQFCCEGCLGIYQMLHEDEAPPPADQPQPEGEKS
jgi:hypothetical protein